MAGASRLASAPPVVRLLRGKRLALVIGVSDYRHLPPLPSARKDAKAMADLLCSWGYTLITGVPVLDPTKKGMKTALVELRRAMEDGCTVVVYFTGHGVKGFLRPVDALTEDRTYGGIAYALSCGAVGMNSAYASAHQLLLVANGTYRHMCANTVCPACERVSFTIQ
jgi:uncharacterized caspase-like protein